ncbi:hypothetical protein IW261DRAFT_1496767 [Armillaria novae-zelandiae]|uniref:F-box domain-containing protein n=1 Tax=Armillaria novae-zelandiae TaxID=153914 RepID=A0AA39P164_9AGAR|nr:hypothetical protein IW261DRAFT_1496767 [Armillaria novae-zelandiae]
MSNENFISRLNDDVLLEIFLHLCTEEPRDERPKYPYPALQLSHVCSHWRAVSLCSYRLWTNITVLISTPATQEGDLVPDNRARHAMDQEEITNIYVQRSQSQSVSIFVCRSAGAPPRKNPPPAEWIFPISDRQISLLCQATGWKEISVLSTWHGEDMCRLLDMGAQCLKVLDTIVLPGHSELILTSVLALASNLRKLHIHGHGCCYNIGNGFSHPDFPFNQICSLAINSSSTRGNIVSGGILVIRTTLGRYFPYIRDLILSAPSVDPREYAVLSRLSLSCLTSLTLWVDYTCQGKVKYYLSNLSLPSLHSFALKYVNNIIQYPFAAESVTDLLSVCSHTLRSISLQKVPIRASSLIDILSVVPGLTRLELRDPVLGSFIPYCPVSQTLAAYIEDNPTFLPDLQAVEFIWQREDTERKLEKALLDMVEMRRAYGKLKEVTIGRSNPYEELSVDTNRRLAALKWENWLTGMT